MKYEKLVITIVLAIMLFCSCGMAGNEVSDNSTESVMPTTSVSNVTTETTIVSTCITETITSKVSLEEQIASYEDGYLYDFDLDGIYEMFFLGNGLYGEVCIYKIIENELLPIGDFPYEHGQIEWFTVPELTLYYDKSNGKYFYVNEYDYWFKYGITAEVNKYVFKNDEIIVTNIAICDMVWWNNEVEKTLEFVSNKLFDEDNTPIGIFDISEVTHYYDGVEEYLSQFEKIKTITFEELTAVSIADVIESGTLSNYLP